MLERVWRKGNPLTLLVGMQTGTATMENSVEISKKLEIELPYDPAIPFQNFKRCLMSQWVKNLSALQETQVQSLVWEDPLEEEMTTHSSTLA